VVAVVVAEAVMVAVLVVEQREKQKEEETKAKAKAKSAMTMGQLIQLPILAGIHFSFWWPLECFSFNNIGSIDQSVRISLVIQNGSKI